MKSLSFAALILLTASSNLVAQGDLTPPGAPTPTMKSLDQIEARTPITQAQLPYTISAAGSYYLTGALTVAGGDAITITADNVSLDLNGFAITSTAGSATGTGVLLSGGHRNITILNGFINGSVVDNSGVFSGGGFNNGISYIGNAPFNVRVTGVAVGGCKINGINLGAGLQNTSTVQSCTAYIIGVAGITANDVSHSSVFDCGGNGIIASTAIDSYGETNGTGAGISAVTATNCRGRADSPGSGTGINAKTVINCYATSIDSQGINASNVSNSYGFSSTSQGIGAETVSNSYGESNSNRGISANVVMGCSGTTHGASYGIFATSIANTSYGLSNTGIGLNAVIAIGCIGLNSGGTAVGYTYHYNMPP